MTTKCYVLKKLYTLVTSFDLGNGEERIVQFAGAQNMNVRGRFVTSDTRLQEAMETSNAYAQGVFGIAYAKSDTRPEDVTETEMELPDSPTPATDTTPKKKTRR